MTESSPGDSKVMRAEFILTSAIAGVSILIILLLSMLWSGARLNANEYEIVAMVRSTRAEMIGVTRAQSDAETLAARFLATRNRDLLDDFELAKTEARGRLAAALALIEHDHELRIRVSAMSELVEQRLNILDNEIASRPAALDGARPEDGVYATFRAQSDELQELLNDRIDVARVAEDAAHRRLDFVSVLLGLLSLVASGLAIFALRRERGQWRLAQEATEAARARAQESDLAKTRFLAVASHDMRQPLHALTLYLSALERRVEGAEARDILQKMDRATQSMVGMFATLLDLARIQAGVVQPEFMEIPLQDVIDRIVAEHPGGKVEARATPVIIRSDPLLLERVLANLVVNALKHGGGKARIEVRHSGDYAQICVADDGPGIPEEDQKRIFEEFVRLDGRSGAEGLGLGLAIVARIADLLGMPIKLDSAAGRGARFTLTAPLVAANGGQQQRSISAPVTLSGSFVVVCDDDALAREAIAGSLRDLGAEVRACGNEAELTSVLSENRTPDLLVMDLRIDGALQGIDIATRARARLSPPPRVIVVTGDTGPETLAMLRASGYAWLIKPVDSDSLSNAAAALVHTPA
jgi:signal transduction histidine kinase/CheY-like chemotaxis protein